MSLSSGSWSSAPDSTSENSNGSDSSNIERMTTIVDNKVLVTCPFCGLVLTLPLPMKDRELSQEVDQEITSHHSIEDVQSAESHQLASPPKTIEDEKVVDGKGDLKEKRKISAEMSALLKKKKTDP